MLFGAYALSEFPLSVLVGEQTGAYGLTTLYAATQGFISQAADTPSQTYFEGRLDVPLRFERSLIGQGEPVGQAALGWGDIEMINSDGYYDSLVTNSAVDGRRVTVKVGTADFAYGEFGVVFDGTARGWEVDEDRVRLLVRDFGYKLEIPVQRWLYSGEGGLAGDANVIGRPKPLLYGKCLNVSAVLIDATQLLYQVHDGNLRSIDAVYDRGALLNPNGGYTVDLATGTFTLSAMPAGEITVDAVGEVLTPASLFSGGTGGAWLDPGDLTSMWQDAGRLTKVTAVGQPVGYLADKSGTARDLWQPTAGARPTLQKDATTGAYYLQFSGAQFMTSVTSAAYQFSSGMTALVAAQSADWDETANRKLLTTSSNGANGWEVGHYAAGTNGGMVTLGGAARSVVAPAALADGPHVLATWCDLKDVALRVDGSEKARYVGAGASAIGYPGTATNFFLGCQGGTGAASGGAYWNGRFYGAVILDRAASASELSIAERFLQDLVGLIAPATVTTSDILNHLARRHGNLADTEIDSAAMAACRSDNGAAVGIYINEQASLRDIMEALAKGIGGWYGFSRAGKLQAAVFKAPAGVSELEFTPIEILDIERLALPDSINPPNWRRRVMYARNWTPQTSDLAGVVTAERRAVLATDAKLAVAQDASILNRHLLATDSAPIVAFFNDETAAQTEADRQLGLYGTARAMYRVTLKTQPFQLDLGDVITLRFPRWGLDNGRQFAVVRISEDATTNEVELTVFG
ncbi:hypothetical protein [Pseudomonas sp. KCJK9000]|uniref:hypothetical protein n=1 Tax=Pseudomonas sp. KCJK9000 TaxID=3344566 RepID=UPI00390589C9